MKKTLLTMVLWKINRDVGDQYTQGEPHKESQFARMVPDEHRHLARKHPPHQRHNRFIWNGEVPTLCDC